MRAVAAAVSRRNVKSALGYSARIRWGALQKRSLAITVEVGHGKGGLSSPVTTTARSPEQERAALSEFTRMTKATRRLLGQQSLTRSSVQELRVVFHYWVGTRSRKILTAKHYREKALKDSEELLEWMLESQNYPSVLQHVFRTDDCASGAIINMVEQYLMPFRGTHQSFVAGADRRLRFQRNVAELKNALLNATKLMDRLQLLHDDPTFTELVPDRFTCNMILNLWVKRCLLLAEHGDSMDNEFVRTALKGVSSVEECLEAMQACQNSLPVPNDVENGTLFLSAWVNSGLPNRAKEAHALLRKLEHDSPFHPSFTAAYNTVLYAYASLAGRDKTNASHALDLFRYMQTKGIECDTTTYSTLLLAYANSGNPGEAMELLSQMEEQAEKTQVFPNNVCYNVVLESLGKRDTDGAPQQADALLQRMQQMYDEGLNPEACPDIVSFTSVIRAWARSSSPQAAEKAEALLIQCRELSGKNKNVTPDIIMYNSVLDAWARDERWQKRGVSGKRADDTRARRAESLLHQMKEADEVRPDACSYNIVMNAWFRSGQPSVAARRARELFDEAKLGYLAGDVNLKPDLISYNTLIKSISKSGMPGCFNEVRSLIKEMEQEGYKPDTITYHSVMYSMVKSGARGAAKMVEEMVADMEQKFRDGEIDVRPNEITFNILLHAYAISNDPDSAVKAEKVLGKMIALSEQGNRKDAAPSLISFTTVLDAYAKTGQAEAAESLFHKLKGFKNIGANAVSYNTVLNALAKSKERDAPRRAEALLNHMQEEYESGNKNVRPNQISFSSLLNCWAKSDEDGAAERAEAILTRMEELALRGNAHVAPNAFAYSTALHAWSRSQSPVSAERALALLTRMEVAYQNGQAFSKPNAYCFNATMNAIAKSSLPDKATKAFDLLHRMIQEYKDGNKDAKPSVTSFSTVLNACAYTNGTSEAKKEAFRIARSSFAELIESDYGEPNAVTYVNFMTCISKLLPRGRNRDMLLDAVFGECSEKGLVNDKLINVLRAAAAPEVFRLHMLALKGQRDENVEVI